MDYDLLLTLGVILLALSIPSLLGGWVETRLSRGGVILFALAAVMIALGVLGNPRGLSLQGVADAMLGVIAKVFN